MKTKKKVTPRVIRNITTLVDPNSTCARCELSKEFCDKCGLNHPPNRRVIEKTKNAPERTLKSSEDWFQTLAGIARESGL